MRVEAVWQPPRCLVGGAKRFLSGATRGSPQTGRFLFRNPLYFFSEREREREGERLDRGSAAFNFYIFPAFNIHCFAVEAIQTIDS